MTEPAPTRAFKVIVLGDAGVGKTTLLWRFARDEFLERPTTTIGVDFLEKSVPLDDGSVVSMQLWDTAGQEIYRALNSVYYRDAYGALFVYDSTSSASLDRACRWVTSDDASGVPVRMLVGAKTDMAGAERTDQDAREAADLLRLDGHSRTSALRGDGVQATFERLATKMRMAALKDVLAETEQKHSPTVSLHGAAQQVRDDCTC